VLTACINDISGQVGTKVNCIDQTELPGGNKFEGLGKKGGKALLEALD